MSTIVWVTLALLGLALPSLLCAMRFVTPDGVASALRWLDRARSRAVGLLGRVRARIARWQGAPLEPHPGVLEAIRLADFEDVPPSRTQAPEMLGVPDDDWGRDLSRVPLEVRTAAVRAGLRRRLDLSRGDADGTQGIPKLRQRRFDLGDMQE